MIEKRFVVVVGNYVSDGSKTYFALNTIKR